MHVCLLNDSFPPVIDGVANVVLNYAKIMQNDKLANVMVGTPRYPDTDYDCYPYKVVPYQSFDTTKIVKGYRAGNIFAAKEMKEMVDFQPDIIHSHCPIASTYLARMLRAQTETPIIFTYHTKFDEDIARAVKSEFIQKEVIDAIVKNIEACDEIWVVSQGAGENMRSLGFEGNYRVMNNGVDFAKGRVSDDKVAEAVKGYDLPEDVPVFLFVGRIISYKGIPIILDAMEKLKAAGRDFRMVFVGNGPDVEQMQSVAKEKGLYDCADAKVIFTGPIYDRDVLRAWNTRADLFLFPSTYDTNGIVVREAAACGLASVLIKGSCAAEGITDDQNGFLIDQNADSMAELLLKVTEDMAHVHQIGQNAMDEIYISWEDSVYAAYERYGEIVELKKLGMLKVNSHHVRRYFENMTDEFIENISDGIKQVFEAPQRVFDNMLDNVEEFKIGWNKSIENGKNEIEEMINSWKDLFQ